MTSFPDEPGPNTPERIRKIMRVLRKKRRWQAFLLMMLAGVRYSEIGRLPPIKWNSIQIVQPPHLPGQ